MRTRWCFARFRQLAHGFEYWLGPSHRGQGSALPRGHILMLLKCRALFAPARSKLVIPSPPQAEPGIQRLRTFFALVQSYVSPCGQAGYSWHCPKVTKRLDTGRGGPIRLVRIGLPRDARHRERHWFSTNPCIPALRRGDCPLPGNPCEEAKSASGCFCGRMPPKRGPCGAARGRRKSPKGGAHDARQFVVRTWMCAQRTP